MEYLLFEEDAVAFISDLDPLLSMEYLLTIYDCVAFLQIQDLLVKHGSLSTHQRWFRSLSSGRARIIIYSPSMMP